MWRYRKGYTTVMWEIIEMTRALAIQSCPLEAAVDPVATAMDILHTLVGVCLDNMLFQEILSITYHGPIRYIPDTQAIAKAAMTVRFRAKVCRIYRGDAMLMRVIDGREGRTFANAYCEGHVGSAEISAVYTPGQLVPVIIEEVVAPDCQPKFSVKVYPWTASGARAPIATIINAVSEEDLQRIKRDTDVLIKQLKELPAPIRGDIEKAIGVRPPNKKAVGFATACKVLTDAAASKNGTPVVLLSLDLGHGTVLATPTTSEKEIAEALPLSQAISVLMLRESGYLSMATEIATTHPDILSSPEQKIVWSVVSKSTLAS